MIWSFKKAIGIQWLSIWATWAQPARVKLTNWPSPNLQVWSFSCTTWRNRTLPMRCWILIQSDLAHRNSIESDSDIFGYIYIVYIIIYIYIISFGEIIQKSFRIIMAPWIWRLVWPPGAGLPVVIPSRSRRGNCCLQGWTWVACVKSGVQQMW